jgi:transposase
MGRETLLFQPTITDAIIENVKKGLTYKDAAEKEGVTARTVRNWMKSGREEEERLQEPGARPRVKMALYRSFYLRMEQAKAEAKAKVQQGWYKSATETTIIRETTIFQILDEHGNVKQESRKISEKEVPPDWRAQQALMNNRYGMVSTSRIVVGRDVLEEMTDEELERVANGEDPFDIVQERLSLASERDS